jgi:hypothetical protein
MQPRIRIFALLAAFAASAAGGASPNPPALAAGTATGSVSIDGKSVPLRFAYAMAQPNKFDKAKTDTAILLTEKPLPESALASLNDLERAGSGEKRTSVLFVIEEDGKPIREVVNHESLSGTNLQMSGMTHSEIKIGSRKAGRIEGSLQTKEPEKFMSHQYELKAQFNAGIREAKREPSAPDAKIGQKLPAGGGEPGKAFLAFHDAVQRKDLAAIRKSKPADLPDMPDEDLKKGLEVMAAMSPAKVAVQEGFSNGDTAVLYVTGMQGTQKQYGTVQMSRSGGQWRMTKESWSDKPPEK